uniref:Glycine N-acyltransferase-like protein n=1 Tax=Chelydra serpentina TaxID=8475 RepID=A0A8C3S422_CHESE
SPGAGLLQWAEHRSWGLGHPRTLTPVSWQVYGTVMHVNRGNPASQEVLVDSWPEFKIAVSPLQVAWDPSDYGTNLYTAFYRDEGACRALLGNSRAVDWGQAFQIQGEPFQPCSIQLLPLPPSFPFPCLCWFYPPTPPPALTAPPPLARSIPSVLTPPHLSLPPALCFRPENGLRLAPVSPAHAKLLSDTWMFGGNSWSLRYLCLLIRHFPNACLLAPEGPPISWSLTDPLAALTHGYTLPEHRGQRHTGSVVGMLAAQLHARGFPVYTRVLPHNEPSLHTLKPGAVVGVPLSRSCAWSCQSFGASSLGSDHIPAVAHPLPPPW